jgi:hypothetical protein
MEDIDRLVAVQSCLSEGDKDVGKWPVHQVWMGFPTSAIREGEEDHRREWRFLHVFTKRLLTFTRITVAARKWQADVTR